MDKQEYLQKLRRLKELRDLKASRQKQVESPQVEVDRPLITSEGVGQATKSALGGLGNAADAATGGFLSSIQDALGTGVDAALKASGDLFVPEGGENPYKDKSIGDLYNQNVERREQGHKALKAAAPIAYQGADLAGSLAIPAKGVGSLVGQGMLQGLARGEGETGLETAGDMVLGGGLAALPIGVIKGAGAVGSKVADTVGNSKFAAAFRGGDDVQKFTNEDAQRELANKISKAVKKKVGDARVAHAKSRSEFLNKFGGDTIDTSNVAEGVEQSIMRFGPDAPGGFGALSKKEAADLARYTEALKQPRTAQELYKIWDDIGTRSKYYENTLKSKDTEINRQLKALQAGIKEKLHDLSPDLQLADKSMSEIIDNQKHLSRAASDTSNESFLSTLGNKNKGNRREAFNKLLGDDINLQKEIDNFETYKAFQGQGGFGSDYGLQNAAGIALGGAAGYGLSDDSGIGTVGSVLGGALGSGRVQRLLLTKGGQALKPVIQKLPSMPAKYQKILTDAARRGGNSLAITHFILGQSDPEYRRITAEDQ